MTDYAALSDSELNRRIAQALGYRVEFHEHTSRFVDTPYDAHTEGDKPGFMVLRPDWTYEREAVGDDEFPEGFDTEEEAWIDEMQSVPRWSNDVGAAMSLIESEPDYIIQRDSEDEDALRYSVQIAFVNPSGLRGGCRAYGERLSRAIAECWLMLKEATG